MVSGIKPGSPDEKSKFQSFVILFFVLEHTWWYLGFTLTFTLWVNS